MASNTENLNLLMKNPSTDGADTFNVQTMLNENWQKIDNNAGNVAQTLANILKPTTPPIIGLPPSTTPDGMFRALGNTGDLHVWRKTVVNSQAVAASYTLGEKANISLASQSVSDGSGSATRVTVLVANSISVSDSGAIIPGTTTEYYTYPGSISAGTLTDSVIAGKFIFVSTVGSNVQLEDVALRDIYYAPSDATLSSHTASPRRYLIASNLQKVIGHPYQPAGTTTTYPVSTYPVSTNPNAYQEGDDAKEAGYTLGEVVTGSFLAGGASAMQDVYWNYSDSLNVSDDGTLTLKDADWANINTGNSASYKKPDILLGKFAQVTNGENYLSGSPFTQKQIVYIPSNAVVSGMYIDRYQPITGYAAIPAGTTIEYLGKLGDKARVQVVSYVGTGTYGEDNPCSITAGFKIKAAIMMYHYIPSSGSLFMISDELSTNYTADIGFSEVNANYSWGKKSADGKTLSWYGTRSASGQFNDSGYKYYVLCIG